MILRLQNGDTIQGSKYRREGVQAQQYQKRKQQQARTLPHSEMKPTLRKKATIKEKLQGKKDQYSFSPRIIGLSGADPVGTFIVEGAALSPLAKVVRPLAKTRYKVRTTKGIDGKAYTVDTKVSDDALAQFQTDNMIYNPETLQIPDNYLIQQNVLRELSWLPQSAQKPVTQMITTGRTSQPTAVIQLPWRQRITARRSYNRALKAQEAIKSPSVTTYSNMQAMPKAEMEALNYRPIAEGVQGVHTRSGNYLNDIWSPDAASTALHEGTHGYQQLVPYSRAQSKLLKDTYLLPRRVAHADSKLVSEMGATNAEIRKHLADQLGHQPTYEELNTYINSLTDNQAVNLFNTVKTNGYMEDYASGLAELPKSQIPQWVQNFKLSQIKVPVTLTGGYFTIKQKQK